MEQQTSAQAWAVLAGLLDRGPLAVVWHEGSGGVRADWCAQGRLMRDNEAALAALLLRIAIATKRGEFSFRPTCFMTERESYEIGPEALDEYRKLPSQLLKYGKSEKRFSLTAVGTMVRRSVARLVDGQATTRTAASELQALLQALSATPPEQTVLRELSGISLPTRTRPLAIAGARVARFTTRDHDRLMRQYRAYACSAISNRKSREIYLAASRSYLDRLKGKTVIWCTYAAEPTRAEELSLETSRRVTTLLRYGCMALRTDSAEMAIGIGLVQSVEYLMIPKEGSISSGAQLIGKYRSWTIVSSDRAKMRKAGIPVLSDLLEESDDGKTLPDTSFRGALLQVLHWAVTSLDQPTNSSKMLALTVALEILFSRRSSSVTTAIAEGTAMTISCSPIERKRISKRMKELYDKRSDVAHGRGGNSLLDSDVCEMENIVTLVISVLCHRMTEFDSLDDFSEALSSAKPSGQVFKGR